MNASPSFSSVAPDPAAIARHLDILFGYLDGLVPVRLLGEAGTSDKAPQSCFELVGAPVVARVQREAPRAQLDGRGVFVVPGVVAAPGRARAADVVASGVLLVDLDAGDIPAKRQHLAERLGAPSLIVASGGRTAEGHEKLHLYWRLTEAAAGEHLALLVRLRGRIADIVGGDRSFASVHQPIRVAGTIHGKNGVQAFVRILADTGSEYELADLDERIAEMPHAPGVAPPAAGRRRTAGATAGDVMTRRVQAGGTDQDTRYSALSKVIGYWLCMARLRRVTSVEAWRAVVEHNAARIDPPWSEDRLRREFDALAQVDQRNHGPMPIGEANPEATAPPPLSEDALAAAFVETHGRRWRYVAVWGAWMRWTGAVWERDETHAVRETVRQVCRGAIPAEAAAGDRRRTASEKTIRAVERIAAADPAIAARASDWDAHPLLLNTPAGVIRLDTGAVLDHEPARMLTQITSASLGSSCPRWLSFLDEITDGDQELARYLARLCGYTVTGSTEEQVFFFLHGLGANGKSVFLQTISKVLGAYAATAPLSAFTSSNSDQHPTDLAGLIGKRLVTVSETEAGRSWAETRIKTVTGGDAVRARFMHRDFFEFTPSFKLAIAGNHRPRLSGVGEATRRRIHLVPFTVTIPPERRDRKLGERLLAERDGILGWMLEGCADWREQGLAPPPCMLASADEYFDEEDLVGQWIAERCVLGPRERATARELYGSWNDWTQGTGADPGSQKSLGDALRGRGLKAAKLGGQRCWLGLALRRRCRGEGGPC